MKTNRRMLLPIVMLLSAQAVAAENAGQGPAKPPAELRLSNSLNMSGSMSVNRNTATAATQNIVDKVEVYIPPSDQTPAQQQPR